MVTILLGRSIWTRDWCSFLTNVLQKLRKCGQCKKVRDTLNSNLFELKLQRCASRRHNGKAVLNSLRGHITNVEAPPTQGLTCRFIRLIKIRTSLLPTVRTGHEVRVVIRLFIIIHSQHPTSSSFFGFSSNLLVACQFSQSYRSNWFRAFTQT